MLTTIWHVPVGFSHVDLKDLDIYVCGALVPVIDTNYQLILTNVSLMVLPRLGQTFGLTWQICYFFFFGLTSSSGKKL